MTLGTRAQLFQSRTYRTVRRAGLAADLTTVPAGAALFNVSGVCAVHYMFGVITTVIGAGLAVPQLQFTPTVGAVQVPLSAVAAAINTAAAGSIITWTGLLAGALTVGAALGMSDVNANSDWAGGTITLTAGAIWITNTVSAVTGVIDWYVAYLPQVAGSLITST